GLDANERTDIRDDAFAFDIDCGRSYGGFLPEFKYLQILRIDGDLRPYCRYIGYGKDSRVFLQRLTLGYGFSGDKSGNRGADVISGQISPLVNCLSRYSKRAQLG